MQELEKILKDKFWLESFRNWQLDIISSIINWKDTLVFMPTWWGKSLTYQMPWIYLKWLCIVISPLISLMKDQVDKLNSLGIRREFINSSVSSFDKNNILNEISLNSFDFENEIKFLYIAPERLNDSIFLKVIQKVNISLIAIDEAHCISQWGHDFRPSYLKIKDFIENIRKNKHFPIVALTATATKKVREDIVSRLSMKDYNIFTKWFDRKNLFLVVREISKEQEKFEKTLEIIKKTPPYWIIYCSSVKACNKVYEYLYSKNIKVWIYNWEMSQEKREYNQEMFMSWQFDVIVATNAFWMWIDKKDIRYVIHFNLPWSIENYYQEIWRAWRDWKPSYAVIIASYQDSIIQEFFIENTYPKKEDILKFYDYLYADFELWKWDNTKVLKTYFQMSKESWVWSDMMVWSIIKIFEKYDILKRWVDDLQDSDFRWRWITLILPKYKNEDIPILWHHQNVLKEESYFKLEQIKKLLFKPWCRNKFILTYFWDENDLKNLWDNCWRCDYCIDKKKISQSWDMQVVQKSVFITVLSFVKKFDEKFWIQILSMVLVWSEDSKIFSWQLDKEDDYGILSVYSKDFVVSIFETLIETWFLYKTFWQFPKIWITDKWLESVKKVSVLYDEENKLQSLMYFKAKSKNKYIQEENKKTTWKENKKDVTPKIDTFTKTLNLFNEWKSLKEIANIREMSVQTIQEHIVKLYILWKIDLSKIYTFTTLEKCKIIKDIIKKNNLSTDKLKPIKDLLKDDISYFDIKICIAMLEKRDL